MRPAVAATEETLNAAQAASAVGPAHAGAGSGVRLMLQLLGDAVKHELAVDGGSDAGVGGGDAALGHAVVVAGRGVGREGRPGRDAEGV